MKRALAARVKEERGESIVRPGTSSSSLPMGYTGMNGSGTATGHPPSKQPRTNVASMASSGSLPVAPMSSTSSHDLPQSVVLSSSASKKRPRSPPNAVTSGNTAAYQSSKNPIKDSTATPKGRGPGRPRKSAAKKRVESSSDEEDERDNSSFYLKHQNSGLASELYAYRRRIYLLEREREYRRKECRVAEYKIGELGGVWKGLECAIGKELERDELFKLATSHSKEYLTSVPPSTGQGTGTETVNSLLQSLKSLVSNPENIKSKKSNPLDPEHLVNDMNNFENYSKGTIKVKEDIDLIDEKHRLKEMEDFATNIAGRAVILRDGVLGLLNIMTQGSFKADANASSLPLLKDQITMLESELDSTESKLKEMANARNEAVASERRVRRGLYRLSNGRMTLDEVLIAVEKEDNGVSFNETMDRIDGTSNKNAIPSPDGTTSATSGVVPSSDGSNLAFSAAVAGGKDLPSANAEDLAQLKKSVQDLQAIADTRDKKIAELLSEKEEHQKRINSLLVPKDSDCNISPDQKAIRKSPLFIDIMIKLESSERRAKELESTRDKIMEKWAAVKGDLELAKKALADMEEKHSRRWMDLVSQFSQSDSAGLEEDYPHNANNVQTNSFSDAKKTAELESKLQQAMESVSRMETLRATLADAYKMNEQLQSKLEDLRTKNAKMVAEKVAAREKSKEAEQSATGDGTSTSPHGSSRGSSRSSSSGDPTYDKLQRDYRRARKEVSAAVLSKDQAKLKQERAEKERDALMKTNVRLLKQSSDKDDMNAKSLSTILHLKQHNEELEKENAIIKQKAQAAQQLSLAARLASNAKDRVGEEALREKQLLDDMVKQLQKECECLRNEKDQVDYTLAQMKSRSAVISKDLDAARTRCDDLVLESNKKEEETKKIVERLAVVKKEAKESALKAAASSGKSEGSASTFTMEQMTTQVKYLSGRINCPVCNVREKNCILLRCRHMFCQQCVDVNIKNRSRKCPACAQRFDTKDVAEIWL